LHAIGQLYLWLTTGTFTANPSSSNFSRPDFHRLCFYLIMNDKNDDEDIIDAETFLTITEVMDFYFMDEKEQNEKLITISED